MKHLRKLASILLITAAPAAWSAAPAAAQSYPNRTVQIVNPTQAGATTDVLGRALAIGLASRLG
jgi:tripartite-type tricarboxylate transporter receptor subunit TctC